MTINQLNLNEVTMLQIFALINKSNFLRRTQLIAILYYTQAELFYKSNSEPLTYNFFRGTELITSPEVDSILKLFLQSKIIVKTPILTSWKSSYSLGPEGESLSKDLQTKPVVLNSLMGWIGYFSSMNDGDLSRTLYKKLTFSQFEIGDRIPLVKIF